MGVRRRSAQILSLLLLKDPERGRLKRPSRRVQFRPLPGEGQTPLTPVIRQGLPPLSGGQEINPPDKGEVPVALGYRDRGFDPQATAEI